MHTHVHAATAPPSCKLWVHHAGHGKTCTKGGFHKATAAHGRKAGGQTASQCGWQRGELSPPIAALSFSRSRFLCCVLLDLFAVAARFLLKCAALLTQTRIVPPSMRFDPGRHLLVVPGAHECPRLRCQFLKSGILQLIGCMWYVFCKPVVAHGLCVMSIPAYYQNTHGHLVASRAPVVWPKQATIPDRNQATSPTSVQTSDRTQ